MNKLKILLPILLILLVLAVPAMAEEAEDLTAGLTVKVVDTPGKASCITDGKYTTYWESKSKKNPWVIITSDKPIYQLYLCFRRLPDSYVIEKPDGDSWVTVAEGGTPRYHHAFFELDGLKRIRIRSTMETKNASALGFNAIFAFGEGEVPDWVQRWEEPVEKADILFLIAHPDDELLFTGGAIPTYGAEKGKQIEVAYLTPCNPTRRSEALNGLWAMGVRNYPVFGSFRDYYVKTGKLKDAYKDLGGKQKVLDWVNELYRRFKPEVVVTHAENGEYGHPQHKVVADAAKECFTLAADPMQSPDSYQAYGTWQVKKLYLHLYGEEADQTFLDWEQPLAAFDGKTGAQLAAEAFALHVSQKGMGAGKGAKFKEFKVETTGAVDYPYDHFGLQNTTVGPDEAKNDYLEHIETEDVKETEPETAEGEPEENEPEQAETENETETETETDTEEEEYVPIRGSGRFAVITPPDWADVELNEEGFLDEGEYIFVDEAEGHYIYVSTTLRVVIERTYETFEKEQKKDPDQELYVFTANIWCDTKAGELPHTVNSNPENPRTDPKFIKDIAAEQKIVFATSTDYYNYRVGRKKNDKSYHIGIEIRNGEILYDDPETKEKQMPNYETLALYQDGRADSYPSKDKEAEAYVNDGATEVFTFGPCLVRDGELTEYIATANRSNNPRLAIGVAEPGHYVVVLCEGRVGESAEFKRSTGVMMKNLAQIMKDQGCTVAVNMDGGQTAVMAFMGKQINRVVKSDPKARPQVEALAFGTSEQVGIFELEGIKFKK